MNISIIEDTNWNNDCTEHLDCYLGQPHKKAIDKAWRKLTDYMNPTPIIEYASQEAFFPYSVIRDLKEFQLTSEKNEEILKRVRAKDQAAYNCFKSYLRNSKQSQLAESLECVEMGKDITDKVEELDDT
ncbi:uncharacterized protein LOC123559352 [Mercenaria mercenaria]|uniref:uncharacterized protein LOC123559352 n=1 Tax=Mercenaria mercenaria TaxID=6596 RepID=UPI00234ECF41|nr:uncharacterized protein LOC123559352 [Mercenaria mercenaria]